MSLIRPTFLKSLSSLSTCRNVSLKALNSSKSLIRSAKIETIPIPFSFSKSSNLIKTFQRTFSQSTLVRDPVSPSPSASNYHSVIVSLSGPDREGLVADVSDTLNALHTNIEESRMTVLGQDFAIIVLVTAPVQLTPSAIKHELEHKLPGFVISTRHTEGPAHRGFQSPVRILSLTAEGPDQPGVVLRLTQLLIKYHVNIRDLDTDTSSAPFAGYKNFSVRGVIAVPVKTDLEAFQNDIVGLGDELGFDIRIADPNEEADPDQEENPGQEEEQENEEEEYEEPEPEPEVRRAPQQQQQARRYVEAPSSASTQSQGRPMNAQDRSVRLAEMEAAMRAASQKRSANAPPGAKTGPSTTRR